MIPDRVRHELPAGPDNVEEPWLMPVRPVCAKQYWGWRVQAARQCGLKPSQLCAEPPVGVPVGNVPVDEIANPTG